MYRNMWFRLRASTSSSASSSCKSLTVAAEEELAMSRSPNSTRSPMSVDKEYNNALRTKSFLDIWKKAHHQLKKTVSTAVVPAASPVNELEKHASSSFSLDYFSQLSDSLLDLAQETFLAATSKSKLKCNGYHRLRHLLLEYYDTTLEACIACTSLLASINRTRTHHYTMRRLLIKFSSTRTDLSTISDKLTAHLKLENPLSPTNQGQFNRTHALYGVLIRRLVAARRRIRQHKMIIKVFGLRWVKMWVGGGRSERAAAHVDSALKGAYIVGRDLDTMSRMVRRLHNEVEREREVGRMAVRNCGNRGVVREVVRGMESEELGFEKQLEELEEHVYLCLVTINKSRRWVVEEMGEAATTSTTMA